MGQHDTVWDALDTLLDDNLAATVAQDDDDALQQGTSVIVMTRQPSFRRLALSGFGSARRMLVFSVEVYAATRANLTDEVDKVIAVLEDYPSLNSQAGVSGLNVEEASVPVPITDVRGAGPYYWMQALTVEIELQYAKSGGEY